VLEPRRRKGLLAKPGRDMGARTDIRGRLYVSRVGQVPGGEFRSKVPQEITLFKHLRRNMDATALLPFPRRRWNQIRGNEGTV